MSWLATFLVTVSILVLLGLAIALVMYLREEASKRRT